VSQDGANRRGILAIVGAMAVFSVSDVLTKMVALTHPLGEVFAVRGLFTILLVGAAMIALGHARYLRAAVSGRVLARSALDATSSALYVAALVHMRLADVSAIVLLSPVILTLMAVIFFGERVDARRWAAVLVGFVGVLFIVRPAPESLNIWALVVLLAAFCSAFRDVTTRRIDPGIPTTVLALGSMIALTLVGLGIGLGEDWRAMTIGEYGLLAGAGLFFGLAIYLIALAFRGVDLSVVAPFRYTNLLCAAAAGYLTFGEIPDGWSIAGAALIVASGLYVLHRDAERRRQLIRQAAASGPK
jgi:drug/metabolite transporter (DMT)-like permease